VQRTLPHPLTVSLGEFSCFDGPSEVSTQGQGNATTQVHHTAWWGCSVATATARTATGDARDRIYERAVAGGGLKMTTVSLM
jgi:hypothetical protein